MHPTTQLALQAIASLENAGARPRNVLDLGCGAGILSLSAAGLWPECRVTAADISPRAVADCREHIVKNRLQERVAAHRSDLLSNPAVLTGGPYDLILCNLLAEPLTGIAPRLKSLAAPEAYLIVSGLLAWLTPQVETAYRQAGFVQLEAFGMREWQGSLWRAG